MTKTTMVPLGVMLLVLTATASTAPAQAAAGAAGLPDVEVATAPVEVDGRVLFSVRGVSAFPAEQRAETIANRIRRLAKKPSFRPEALQLVDHDGILGIMGGELRVMVVHDSDARLEGVAVRALAEAYLARTRQAIEDYRYERSSKVLLRTAASTLGATVALATALFLLGWVRRRLDALLEARVHSRVRSLGISSFEIVRGEHVWSLLNGVLGTARVVAVVVLLYLYLSFVLGAFPWTRWIASRLGDWVVRPLRVMGHATLAQIPNLIFLAVLLVVVRYLLRLLKLFFGAVAEGNVPLKSFDRDWAIPTYKIARLAVIVFALVVAYPYIPGSGSAAFKGVSLFIGVVFSLGSSSAIANTIAGYALIYRRAFKVGDRVRIGEAFGDVTEVRNMVTHLKTTKNEEVVIPNSEILRQEVVNYSTFAGSRGLFLHTTVGIGYETPWRQVEAMLLLAAGRTEGLLEQPPPFVLQKALGDFCVTYEINAACNQPQEMNALYTRLHRSILDVFNEYGVQIMTPAYEGDTDKPKIVARDQWFAAPAVAPAPDRGEPGKE